MTQLAQAAQAGVGVSADVVLFWVFAVMALGAAVAVISLRNVVHAALMLVVNLLAISGLFLTLESPFLAVIQVLVYGGAIMVLFLFVIMLLGVDRDDLLRSGLRTRVLAVTGGALLAGAVLFAFVGPYTSEASVCGPDRPAASADEQACFGLADAYAEDDGAGAAFLGRSLFTTYTYPFELAALLLTVATIGAVILARRRELAPEDEDALDVEADPDPADPDPADPGPAEPDTGAHDGPGDTPATAETATAPGRAHGAAPGDEREG